MFHISVQSVARAGCERSSGLAGSSHLKIASPVAAIVEYQDGSKLDRGKVCFLKWTKACLFSTLHPAAPSLPAHRAHVHSLADCPLALSAQY